MEAVEAPAHIPNSREWTVKNAAAKEYHIQAAWPLAWDSHSKKDHKVPVFYVLDGNAYFFSTVESVRRNAVLPGGTDGIVVGIGYPPSKFPFDGRRNYDLTPPAADYTAPADPDGKVYPVEHGGATFFVEFLVQTVREHVFNNCFPREAVSKEILVGHSYGALCTLHALFTKATPFDAFIAISPSIWWNGRFILSEQKSFLEDQSEPTSEKGARKPQLLIAYGTYEQHPCRLPAWSDAEYEKYLSYARSRAMGENATAMYKALKDSTRLHSVGLKVYRDEDHLSVAMCGINWAVSCVADPNRFG